MCCPTISPMQEIAALVVFSFVSAATPGPNNVLLWASGAQFGFRRTLPHIAGTVVGIGALALAVAAGIGAVVTGVPAVAVLMKMAGSAYLLYLAWQIALSGALERADVSRPLSLLQAAAFQWINPKGWIFALGAVTTFRPPEVPVVIGSVAVAMTMMAVVVPSASLWAVAGGVVARILTKSRGRRIISLGLGATLVATVALVWL